MKKLYILFVICSFINLSQAQSFVWAKQMGGPSTESGMTVKTDAAGNIYTAGYFHDSIDVDPGLGVSMLMATGAADVFVSKMDSSGNLLWAKQIGGPAASDSAFCNDLVLDGFGNIFLLGYFAGTIDFDPDAGFFNLSSFGMRDAFACVLTGAGNYLSAKQMGGVGDDFAESISLDALGNIYIVGEFQGTADFNPDAGVYELVSAGNLDIFIAKLDALGNFLWAKQMGGGFNDLGYSIALDANGYIYSSGGFQGTADFDPDTTNYSLTSAGDMDIFVSKLDASGNFVWAQRMGGGFLDYSTSLALEASGNLYLTGNFQGTVDFNPDTTNSFILSSAGGSDVFVSRFDTLGNFVWAFQIGGTQDDGGYSLTLDNSGNVYVIGTFQGRADFYPSTGVYYLSAIGGTDIFLGKFDASGSFVWVRKAGNGSNDGGSGIAVDAFGYVYATGSFSGTVDFDPGNSISNLTSAGDADVFVMKLRASCSNSFSAFTASACSSYTSPSGNLYTTSDVYIDIIPNTEGCDSIITITLTINPTPTVGISPLSVTICSGESATLTANGGTTYTWNNSLGNTVDVTVSPTSTTTYFVTVTDANTCTATASRTVNVNQSPAAAISPAVVEICIGDSVPLSASGGITYEWSNVLGTNAAVNVSPASTTTYSVTVTDASACTATASRTVTVNQPPVAVILPLVSVICSGESDTLIVSGGVTYTWSNSLGNDSMVTVSPTITTDYFVTVTDANACSATASRTVSVNQSPAPVISPSTVDICSGESAQLTVSGGTNFEWSNSLGSTDTVTVAPLATTTYTVTATEPNGCTGTNSRTVNIHLPESTIQNNIACLGTAFPFNGQFLTLPGTYSDTLTTVFGCDSMINLILGFDTFAASSFTASVCRGSGYFYNGVNRTSSGVYRDTLLSSTGCDSIVTLNLTVNSNSYSFNQAICSGGSFLFNGQNLTSGGTYMDTLINSGGCDSIIALNLAVNNPANTAISASICSGETYSFGGSFLTAQGTYRDTLLTSGGCDSIITLALAVNSLPLPTITRAQDTLRTQSFASYQWMRNDAPVSGATSQSLTMTQPGNYRVLVTNANGCSDTSAVFNVINVDMADLASEFGVKLYPNPNTGKFTLEFTDDAAREIEITDALGKTVSSTSVTKSQRFNLENSAASVYYLRIKETNGRIGTIRFIKED